MSPDSLVVLPGATLNALESRLNIVLVAEGFSGAAELALFRGHALLFAARIKTTRPFDTYRATINVLALETESPVSATLLTRSCPPSPLTTRFGATFCASGQAAVKTDPERVLFGRDRDVIAALEAQPALRDQPYSPIVLVNSGGDGGSAPPAGEFVDPGPPSRHIVRQVAWATIAGDWVATVLHELGHSMFDLADEYEYDNGPAAWQGAEPTEPNVSSLATKSALAASPVAAHRAWSQMIRAGLPTPSTKRKPDFEPRDNVDEEPLEPGVSSTDVGLFEGAKHFPRGIFRPQSDCRMRHSSAEFCQVCDFAIRSRLGHWKALTEESALAVGPVTSVAFVRSGLDAIVTYDGSTGGFAVLSLGSALNRDNPNTAVISEPGARTEPGWTSLTAVRRASNPAQAPVQPGDELRPNDRLLFANSFATGRSALLEVAIDLDADENPATLANIQELTSGFASPWTSVSSFDLLKATHVLGYNRFTGEAALMRVDPLTLAVTEAASWRSAADVWQTGWDHVLAVANHGLPFVARLSTQGPRDVHPLLPFGRRPPDLPVTDAPQNFGGIGFSHATAYATADGAHLVRYAAINGRCVLEVLRPQGESFDVAASMRLAPNALSLFGVGAGVLASAQTFGVVHIAFAHAPTGSMRLFRGGPAATL